MSNSDQRIELLEDPGSTTPLDYEKLYLEKQYQIKEPFYNVQRAENKVLKACIYSLIRVSEHSLGDFRPISGGFWPLYSIIRSDT